MTDPLNPDIDFDSDAFEEWIARTAESKGISRGEVLDQMLSSYWILEELTGMMAPEEGPDALDTNRSTEDNQQLTSDRSDEGPDDRKLAELVTEFQALRTALVEGQDNWERGRPAADGTAETGPGSFDAWRLYRELDELADRIDEVAETASGDSGQAERLEQEIATATEGLRELEGQLDDAATVAMVDERFESVRSALDRTRSLVADHDEQLTRLSDRVDSAATERSGLESALNSLEQQVEYDLDGIEDLFDHLLETTDQIESRVERVERVERGSGDEFAPLEEFVTEQKQLGTVLRAAHQHGVSRADCGNCEAEIDLSLLERPRCPHCSTWLTGIEPSTGWLPFSRSTVTTESVVDEPADSLPTESESIAEDLP